MSAAGWIVIFLLAAGVGLGVYFLARADKGWSSGSGSSSLTSTSTRPRSAAPARPRTPVTPTRPAYAPPPGAGTAGGPRTSRVKIRSSRPAPPGYLPPRAPAGGDAGHVQARRARESCSYCSSLVGPVEPFVRCTAGHIAHQECMSASGGLCSVQYCGASVA